MGDEADYINNINVAYQAIDDVNGKDYSKEFCEFCGEQLLKYEKETCTSCSIELKRERDLL